MEQIISHIYLLNNDKVHVPLTKLTTVNGLVLYLHIRKAGKQRTMIFQ